MKRFLRLLCLGVAWISVAAAWTGFWMPWALVAIREPGVVKQFRNAAQPGDALAGLARDLGRIAVTVRRGTETLTGELPSLADIPREVSGADIPRFANREQTKLAMALIELMTNTRRDLGRASYLVWLVPGLALLSGMLLTVLGRRPIVAAGIAALCAAVAGLGCWRLLTTSTQALFVAITIGRGLWLSLWAYAGLAAAAAGLALCYNADKRRRDSSGSRAQV